MNLDKKSQLFDLFKLVLDESEDKILSEIIGYGAKA